MLLLLSSIESIHEHLFLTVRLVGGMLFSTLTQVADKKNLTPFEINRDNSIKVLVPKSNIFRQARRVRHKPLGAPRKILGHTDHTILAPNLHTLKCIVM